MLINDYEIIVIGGNHHNTLGVIRCLGEKKIKSNLIVINENRYAYITKSKYVKNFDIVNYDEETIKKILLKKYSKFKNKAILIPTSDFAALFIDKNLNELKKYFTVSSINNKQNEIEKMMDKYNQYLLARKNNIKISKSLIFDLNEKISDEIPVPCILKPISSVLGNKDDIEICNTKDELKEKIEILKNKKYLKILIQELVDYDYECDIVGCSNKSKLIVPGAVRKIRRYPIKGGSNSFSKILSLDSFKFNIDKILKQIELEDINYATENAEKIMKKKNKKDYIKINSKYGYFPNPSLSVQDFLRNLEKTLNIKFK